MNRIAGAHLLACAAAAYASAAAAQDHVPATAKLDAAYTITFARIGVGAATLKAELNESEYSIAATAHAGSVMRVLINGQAALSTRGAIRNGTLVPATFTSRMQSGAQIESVRMTFEHGDVKEAELTPPAGASGLTEADRQGVVDPLTAMLVPAWGSDDLLSQEACRRTLPVLDGRNRYDLKLAFKRMDRLSGDQGYRGPVVICALSYVSVAGPHGSAPLVKYLAEGRDMEVALAPISGAPVLAPVRLSVASSVANLIIAAERFDASAQPTPAPLPVSPAPTSPVPQ